MNYFNLPNFKEWVRFFGWVAIKLLVSFLQFLLLALEKLLEVFLYSTKMTQKTLTKIALVIDHLPYSGIPLARLEKLEAVEITALPSSVDIKFFDFTELRSNPDKFPHIRVIGKTGVGKTRFTEWIMDMLGGEQFVITPKKKPTDWINHKVYGYPFDYPACERKLVEIHKLMHLRYALMEEGKTPYQINFACDEWKLINKNISSAKELMKDIIIVARDAKIRLIALAQGENVATWGLEGESDLEECFSTVRFGDFATEHCKFLRNKYRKDSLEYDYYSAVLKELESQGFRCCMVENQPARVPDLGNWKPGFKDTNGRVQVATVAVVDPLQNGFNDSMEKPPETTPYQTVQTLEPNLEGSNRVLWLAIKSALDCGRSVDWCAKNIPGLPGNYYSARSIVEKIIEEYGE